MTTFNREKYVSVAIESVLASTFSNFELIIVDDCSEDGTLDILLDYQKKDARVRVYQNEINLGDYPNRNRAASYAVGKYLKYVDADDFIYPFGLELMVNYMEQDFLKDVAFGVFGLTQDNESPYPLKLSSRDAIRRHFLYCKFTLGVAPLSVIIRRDVFENEGRFNPNRMTGDYELWTRISLKHSIVILPIIGCWYRKHSEQEVVHVLKYLGFYYKINKEIILKSFELNYFSKEEYFKIKRRFKRKFIQELFGVFKKSLRFSDVNHLLKTANESFVGLLFKSI